MWFNGLRIHGAGASAFIPKIPPAVGLEQENLPLNGHITEVRSMLWPKIPLNICGSEWG